MSLSQAEANAMAALTRRVEAAELRLKKIEEVTGLGPAVETLLTDAQRQLMEAFRVTAPKDYRILPLADQKRPGKVRAFALLSPAGATVAETQALHFGEDAIKDWITKAVAHAKLDGAALPKAEKVQAEKPARAA